MANTRVKVRREVLIEKLNAERERIVAAHQAELAKADKARAEFLGKLKQEVDAYRQLLDDDPDAAMERLDSYWRTRGRDRATVRFPKLVALEVVPAEPDTRRLDRSLAVLRAAEDDTLSIAADDEYAKYL